MVITVQFIIQIALKIKIVASDPVTEETAICRVTFC
jgi:hypothetical protein